MLTTSIALIIGTSNEDRAVLIPSRFASYSVCCFTMLFNLLTISTIECIRYPRVSVVQLLTVEPGNVCYFYHLQESGKDISHN